MSMAPPESRSQLPAWGVSVLLHAIVVVAAMLLLARVQPRGAAESPGREVGIVLRRADADADMYLDEGEATTDQQTASQTDSPNNLPKALPNAAQAAAAAASFLPKTPGLGPAASQQMGVGGVGEMAGGGGARRQAIAGGKAAVSVFGVEGVGKKFVYAFDRSVSMSAEGRLAAAKRQMIASLASLDSVHQFQVMFFNQRTHLPDLTGVQNRVAFASDTNKELAERFIAGVLPEGGTDRFIALREALRFTPDVVFFLTDADDPMTAAELGRIRQQNNRVGATICTIEFGSGPEHGRENFLKQLARMTGGQYGYVDTSRLPRR